MADRARDAAAELKRTVKDTAAGGFRTAKETYQRSKAGIEAKIAAHRTAGDKRDDGLIDEQHRADEQQAVHERFRTFDKLKTNESPVPVFLMPTGISPDDYVVLYRFDRFLAELHGRKFMRPKLQVWACREDVGRSPLTESFVKGFLQQLRAQRELELAPETAARQAQIKEYERTSRWAGVRAGSAAAAAGGATLLMLAFTNPLVDLALLVVAAFGGSRAGVELVRKYWSSIRRGMTRSEIASARAELEADLSSKQRELAEAIDRMQVCVHPRLFTVYEAMCELENQPWPTKPAAFHPLPPSLEREFESPLYLDALPEEYRAFLGTN